MLSRQQRIRKLEESLRSREEPERLDFSKLLAKWESQPPSSECRFDELREPLPAIALIKNAAIDFGRDAHLNVKPIVDAKQLPTLSPDSNFKYSSAGGGSYSEHKRRMQLGENVLIFVALEHQTAIGYALVDLNSSSDGREVKIIDVETASRRAAGFQKPIQVEGQIFDVGVAHLLATSIVKHFDVRLHADATHDSSRYVFKSVGFSSYSANNPCLLETRPRQ